MTLVYTMPGPQGGQEVELIRKADGFDFFKWPLGEDLTAELRLPAGLAKPVRPPLPPEPPNDSAVRVGRQIHRRDDLAAYNDEGSDACWFGAGFTAPHTWAELCAKSAPSDPVLLVPAPEPVTLPWEGEDPDREPVYVEQSNPFPGRVYVTSAGAHLTPDTADAMAAALTTAAAKARQGDA